MAVAGRENISLRLLGKEGRQRHSEKRTSPKFQSDHRHSLRRGPEKGSCFSQRRESIRPLISQEGKSPPEKEKTSI